MPALYHVLENSSRTSQDCFIMKQSCEYKCGETICNGRTFRWNGHVKTSTILTLESLTDLPVGTAKQFSLHRALQHRTCGTLPVGTYRYQSAGSFLALPTWYGRRVLYLTPFLPRQRPSAHSMEQPLLYLQPVGVANKTGLPWLPRITWQKIRSPS